MLIEKVSKNIVSKSKASLVVAEELRKLHKKLNKKNLTRWNSTLFMIRSVLNLSPEDMKTIRNNMPSKTADQKAIKRNFDITTVEREMLSELKQLLEMFEFVTDELQSNRINISRVYPCIQYLLNNLKAKDEFGNDVVYEYTGALRDGLVESLKKRFGVLIKDDLFIISTLLDPNFGLSYLEVEDQQRARSKLISMIRREEAKQLVISSNSEKENNSENLKIKNLLEKRESNFPQFKQIQHVKKDIIEDLVDNYISTISSGDFKQCALVFWKAHEVKFKAKLK